MRTEGVPWDGVEHVVVDVANLLGSRPDGWWRDRAGATARLLDGVAAVASATTARWAVVLEGRARDVPVPPPLDVVRAERDGDSALADLVATLGGRVLVVTADRGLRDRLPDDVTTTGPAALRDAASGR